MKKIFIMMALCLPIVMLSSCSKDSTGFEDYEETPSDGYTYIKKINIHRGSKRASIITLPVSMYRKDNQDYIQISENHYNLITRNSEYGSSNISAAGIYKYKVEFLEGIMYYTDK